MAGESFAVQVVGVGHLESWMGRFISQLPQLAMDIPKELAPTLIQNLLLPSVLARTPKDTGALQAETDWREVEEEPEYRAEIFSTAENVRTGYRYAQARAFGFNQVNGIFWNPPEDPPYPMAAAQAAGGMIPYLAAPESQAIVKRMLTGL